MRYRDKKKFIKTTTIKEIEGLNGKVMQVSRSQDDLTMVLQMGKEQISFDFERWEEFINLVVYDYDIKPMKPEVKALEVLEEQDHI